MRIVGEHYYRPQPEATERVLQDMPAGAEERLLYEDPTPNKIHLPYLVRLYSQLHRDEKWDINLTTSHKNDIIKRIYGKGPGYLWAKQLRRNKVSVHFLDTNELMNLQERYKRQCRHPLKILCLPSFGRDLTAEHQPYALAMCEHAARNDDDWFAPAWVAEQFIPDFRFVDPQHQPAAMENIIGFLATHPEDGVRAQAADSLSFAVRYIQGDCQQTALDMLDKLANDDVAAVRLAMHDMAVTVHMLPPDKQIQGVGFMRLLGEPYNPHRKGMADGFANNIHLIAPENHAAAVEVMERIALQPVPGSDQPYDSDLRRVVTDKFFPKLHHFSSEQQVRAVAIAAEMAKEEYWHEPVADGLLTSIKHLQPEAQLACMSIVDAIAIGGEYYSCQLVAEYCFVEYLDLPKPLQPYIVEAAERLRNHDDEVIREKALQCLKDAGPQPLRGVRIRRQGYAPPAANQS